MMLMSQKKNIVILGDAFVDIFCKQSHNNLPMWGEDRNLDGGIEMMPGGSASNTACHLKSLLGSAAKITFCTALGIDAWADILRTKYSNVGVDLQATISPTCHTGACVVISGASDRAFMTSHGALDRYDVEELRMDTFAQADHIHIGGLFSLQSMKFSMAKFIHQVRCSNPNVTVSLDTNFDASQKWGDLPDGSNYIYNLLPNIDVFLPNDVEALAISRKNTIEEALTVLNSKLRINGAVIITKGPDGAHGKHECESWHIPVPGSVTAVDSCGAGDCFNAGFLSEWVYSRDFVKACRRGVRAGSIGIQNIGACNILLTKEMLDADDALPILKSKS